MMTRYIYLLALAILPLCAAGQTATAPADYTALVKKLEAGDTTVNYAQFRNSFLASKQFRAKEQKKALYDSLQRTVGKLLETENYDGIISSMKGMLAIDYTSLFAHKYISQAYNMKGDSKNAEKHRLIEEGLLRSIIKSGDGNGCSSSWKVIQNEEQYFVVYMLGSTYLDQKLYESGEKRCNAITVREKTGTETTYYFDLTLVMSGR